MIIICYRNNIKNEINNIPNNHPIKKELLNLIYCYLNNIPEDVKQVMELYNSVYEKYEELVDQAFSLLKQNVVYNIILKCIILH